MGESNSFSSNVIKMNKNLGEYIENSTNPSIFKSPNGLYYTVYPDKQNNTYTTSQDIHYKVYPFDELKIYLKNTSKQIYFRCIDTSKIKGLKIFFSLSCNLVV